jgi:hypothetical protein
VGRRRLLMLSLTMGLDFGRLVYGFVDWGWVGCRSNSWVGEFSFGSDWTELDWTLLDWKMSRFVFYFVVIIFRYVTQHICLLKYTLFQADHVRPHSTGVHQQSNPAASRRYIC